MKLLTIAALGACALAAVVTTRTRAQVPGGLPPNMTPDQAAQMLQNPQLGALVRQRLAQSGLTPDQIRAQLVASGYPANLLDAYFGVAPPGGLAPPLNSQAFAALQQYNQQTNTGCLICHTVGYGVPTGFTSAAATPHLQGVQCENCHGVAGNHAEPLEGVESLRRW